MEGIQEILSKFENHEFHFFFFLLFSLKSAFLFVFFFFYLVSLKRSPLSKEFGF